MNNVEKGNELIRKYKFGNRISPVVNDRMYDAVLEMAEWKDEEFSIERKVLIEKIDSLKEQRAALRASNEKFRKEFLDKACEWLSQELIYPTSKDEVEWAELEIEKFRKYMKE